MFSMRILTSPSPTTDDHCCDTMTSATHNTYHPISYNKRFREYMMFLSNDLTVANMITTCPWCGTHLPKPLHKAYYDTLYKEHNIDATQVRDEEDVYTLPYEFQNDRWWKRRGL